MTMTVTAAVMEIGLPCKFTSLQGTQGSLRGSTPEHKPSGGPGYVMLVTSL